MQQHQHGLLCLYSHLALAIRCFHAAMICNFLILARLPEASYCAEPEDAQLPLYNIILARFALQHFSKIYCHGGPTARCTLSPRNCLLCKWYFLHRPQNHEIQHYFRHAVQRMCCPWYNETSQALRANTTLQRPHSLILLRNACPNSGLEMMLIGANFVRTITTHYSQPLFTHQSGCDTPTRTTSPIKSYS